MFSLFPLQIGLSVLLNLGKQVGGEGVRGGVAHGQSIDKSGQPRAAQSFRGFRGIPGNPVNLHPEAGDIDMHGGDGASFQSTTFDG